MKQNCEKYWSLCCDWPRETDGDLRMSSNMEVVLWAVFAATVMVGALLATSMAIVQIDE